MTIQQSHKDGRSRSGKYLFNPYEIALCGTKPENDFFHDLAEQFSNEYDICQTVYFPGNQEDFVLEKTQFLNFEFVFINTQFNPNIPKIVYINPDESSEEIMMREYSNIIAFAGTKENYENLPDNIPYFQIDQLKKIKEYILNFFNAKIKKTPLYGLVLTGGGSNRMKTDKSLLQYHGKSQTEFLYELITPFCEKVFISSRESSGTVESLPIIQDKLLDFGPIGGILSAMDLYPDTAWLILACDLPYIDSETIKNLLEQRNPFKIATAYKSTSDGFPEPLCAIYEPKSKIRLFQFLGLGYICPRKALINSNIKLLDQVNHLSLTNVNYPEEYQIAMDYFNKKKEIN